MPLIGLTLVGYVVYWIAFYTVDPSFHVKAIRGTNGCYRFEITSNFSVRNMRVLSIAGANGKVMEDGQQVVGKQTLLVASGLASNDTVTRTCGLQYDRIAPAITTKTKSIVLR